MGAADVKIPYGTDAGIAGFATESYSGPLEIRYGENVLTTTHQPITVSADFVGRVGTVVNVSASGVMTKAVVASGASNANRILAEPVNMVSGQAMTVPFYREGHFNMGALDFDATFTTDELKRKAFEAGSSPTIFVSKPKFSNDAINI